MSVGYHVQRPTMDPIAYLKTVDTPTLANAIELLNLRPRSAGFTPLSIRCMFPEFGRMCGYAVTAHVETVTRASGQDRGPFPDLFAAIDASPKPAIVVMQEMGGHRDSATHCGEILASIFTRLGAIGLVSDCGIRDIPEVRAIGMHYFARGAVASHAYFRMVRASEPVQIEGLEIRPGELLHGDENGLITVPPCPIEDIAAAVDKIRGREGRLLEFVRGAEFTLEGLKTRFLE